MQLHPRSHGGSYGDERAAAAAGGARAGKKAAAAGLAGRAVNVRDVSCIGVPFAKVPGKIGLFSFKEPQYTVVVSITHPPLAIRMGMCSLLYTVRVDNRSGIDHEKTSSISHTIQLF